MDFETYRPLALRTAKMFPTQREDLRHAALGLITEPGEFATEVKRLVIYGKSMTEEMRLHMIEELGDTQWYVPLALLALGHGDMPLPDVNLEDLGEVNTTELGDLAMLVSSLCATISLALIDGAFIEEAEMYVKAMSMLIHVIDTYIAPLLGTTGDQMRIENIAKLRARFPDKYTDEAAEARADKGGLPAAVS